MVELEIIIKLLPLLYVWHYLDLILIPFSNIILGLGEDIRAITVSDLVLGSPSNVNNKFKKKIIKTVGLL